MPASSSAFSIAETGITRRACALRRTEVDGDGLAVPASVLAEILVGPLRRGIGTTAVDRLLDGLAVTIIPADEVMAREAGTGVRLPDALVVAMAVVAGADRLLTTDARWSSAVAERFDGVIEIVGPDFRRSWTHDTRGKRC
jgi:predicted nucleic acid-binding protein